MSKIKVLIASGIPLASAVKAALGMTVRDFAAKHGLLETTVSGVINGSTPYPYERVRNALAAELEVERTELDAWLEAAQSSSAA